MVIQCSPCEVNREVDYKDDDKYALFGQRARKFFLGVPEQVRHSHGNGV